MSDFDRLFELVGILARKRYQIGERHFATLGLNHTEARLLTLLHEHDGIATQDALSQKMHIDRTNAGRALKRLEQDGYIQKVKHQSDKRANLIQITEMGRETYAEIRKLRKEMAQSFFGDMSKGEAAEIVRALEKAFKLDSRPAESERNS